MTDQQWRNFFLTCSRVLGTGGRLAHASQSWCAWTTFSALEDQVQYWSAGVPGEEELRTVGTADGGTAWGQPFAYQDLAHVVIPARFYWERGSGDTFEHGTREQDIRHLSHELLRQGIDHRLTELVLEVKLY